MKKTISFLLVLSIALTSFSCTTKPKPEPFTPLEFPFGMTILSALPSQNLNLVNTWPDFKALLEDCDWVEDATVVDWEGTEVLSAKDTRNNLYVFYTRTEDEAFVIVTRKDDKQRFGYRLNSASFTSLYQHLGERLLEQSLRSAQLSQVQDIIAPYRSTTNREQLDLIFRMLLPETWIRVTDKSPEDGIKVFEFTTALQDTYTFYSASVPFVIVTRLDSSTYTFSIWSELLTDIETNLQEYFVESLATSRPPTAVYIGTRDAYDDLKLVPLSDEVIQTLQVHKESYGDWIVEPLDHSSINPNAKILCMTKNVDGTYTTLYDDPSLKVTNSYWTYKISVGPNPFHGPDNKAFAVIGEEAQAFYAIVALYPISDSSIEHFELSTSTTYTFPHHIRELYGRTLTTTGKLNSAMITALSNLESAMVQADLDIFMSGSITFQLKLKNDQGVEYYFQENMVIIDEDPKTPGAVYFQFSNNHAFDAYLLEFLAQLTISGTHDDLVITQIKDPASENDAITWITLSEAQSLEISDLVQSSSWYVSYYLLGERLGNPEFMLKTTSGAEISFYYTTTNPADATKAYVHFSFQNRLYSMPIDQFNAILERYQSVLD